jgi:hypothetical protein
MVKKTIVKDKVKGLGNRRFQIEKEKSTETDITVFIEADGDYVVEKLDVDDLPKEYDGKEVVWYNNFAIKKNGSYIKQKYTVTIKGLGSLGGGARVVICDREGKLSYYNGKIIDDTITLTDGDPGIGKTT